MPADNAACLGKYAGVSLLPMLYRQGNESMMWVWMLNMFAECGRCSNKFSEHLLFQIDDMTETCHALLVFTTSLACVLSAFCFRPHFFIVSYALNAYVATCLKQALARIILMTD